MAHCSGTVREWGKERGRKNGEKQMKSRMKRERETEAPRPLTRDKCLQNNKASAARQGWVRGSREAQLLQCRKGKGKEIQK